MNSEFILAVGLNCDANQAIVASIIEGNNRVCFILFCFDSPWC